MKDLHIDEHNKNDINKANKLIAEFMELPCQYMDNDKKFPIYENPYTGEYEEPIALSYEESWDWLIPVLLKIGNVTQWTLVMEENTSYWCNEGQHFELPQFMGYFHVKNIHEAIIEFIEWYNENNK